MSISLTSPTIEHHRLPLGIGDPTPRISWRFTGSAKDWIQSSYEVEISRPDTSAPPEIYKVESEDSVLVPWPSAPLKSRERASVRVRSFGGSGSDVQATEWSETVELEVGLLERGDWSAKLVGAERIFSHRDSLRPMLFSKAFALQGVKKARLYITAYGVYEAYINDKRVGDHVFAPGWTSYKHRLHYQTFDVTGLLKPGENTIRVEVGEGWYCGRLGFDGGKRNIYGDQLAVLAQLEVELEDGKTEVVGSDGSWKTSVGPLVASEFYDGETYDTSQEIVGWKLGDTWKPVEELEFPKVKLLAPEGPPIRKIEDLKPQKIWQSPSGKIIVDFGQNLVGGVRLRTSGPKGQKIILTHTEVLENEEVATRPLRDCKAVDTIILGDGAIEWEPKFTFHGFRYVQVEGWPQNTGMPVAGDLKAVVIHTDMEPTGWFECSEPMVNQLHENIVWGMRGNFVGLPTDCPQRDERLGWTGDIQVFAPTANFLYDTSGILSSWLKDLALEQVEDYNGVVPQVVPNVIDPRLNTAQAVWGDVAVITPSTMYSSFGDKKFLENQYTSMQAWLSAIPRGENRLWDPNLQQLGDWLDPAAPPSEPANGRTDPHFVASAYLVHVTELMSQISTILTKPPLEIANYAHEAITLKQEFQNNYITPTGRLAPDTQTSLSLALSFSLFSNPTHTSAAAARLSLLARSSRFRIPTGFVGTPLILPALTASGHEQIAYRMLLETSCPSWLYTVKMGATTMWERWDSMLPDGSINPGEMTSFNHYALGSVGAFLHASVGGISMLKEGWKEVLFAPVPGGMVTWGKTRHLGPYGVVGCEWEIVEGKLRVRVEIPPNSRGVVRVEGMEERRVGSGVHEFEVPWREKEWPPKPIYNPFAQYEDADKWET